jgi:hypothetical protein
MDLSESAVGRLRLLGGIAVAYLTLFGALLLFWLRVTGVDGSWMEALVCFAPAALGLWLARTSTEDRNQYIARVLACMSFLPILLLFWATSLEPETDMPARLVWPFAVGAGMVHAAAFVGMIFWGGSYATMVPAAPGASMASADDLLARLMSLNALGAPFGVTNLAEGEVLVSLRLASGGARGHQVKLRLRPRQRLVQVREKLSANMARPSSAEEASMRGAADSYFDPTRPSASRVSGTTLQTSMIDPQKLAAMPLRMFGQKVELPDGYGEALGPDAIVTLLCAVVTGSGWRWQPVFFGSAEA